MVELTSVVKNYPLRTKNILIRYCRYCIYCGCYIEDWVNGAETGILPQKQTSAWWCSGGCSPCGGAADDNVHDAGESHHKLWPTFEPGNVFVHVVLGYFLTSWLTAKFQENSLYTQRYHLFAAKDWKSKSFPPRADYIFCERRRSSKLPDGKAC